MVGTRDDVVGLDFATLDDRTAREVIQRANDAFCHAANRNEPGGFLAWCAPDVYFQSATARADGTDYRGHAGMRDYFAQLRDVFSETEIELEELDRAGPNVLRTRNRWRARGRGSGAILETTMRAELAWEPGRGIVRLIATIDPDDDLRP